MLGWLYLGAFEFCGVAVADRLTRRYGLATRLWLGLTLGLGMLMWFPSLFAFALRFSMAAHWCALAAAGACAAAALLLPRKGEEGAQAAVQPPMKMMLAVAVPLVLLMAWMQYTHNILPSDSGAILTGQSTYGDLNLHLGIATGLQDAAYPPEYTILPGTLLGYPFLVDAMSGSLHMLGMPLRWAFTVPGVLMSGLVFWGFAMLAWELTKDARSTVLASALMFFNGGLGFIYVIDGAMGNPARFLEVFTGFYKAPANLVDKNIRWVNVMVDMMLPQRTLLAGWLAVIPALWLLARCLKEKDRRLFVMLGVWAGFMPMIHTHSFMALGLVSAGAMVYALARSAREGRKETFLHFLLYGAVAVALALPQLLTWAFPQTIKGGSLAFRPNWVNWNGHGLIDEYFWFWLKNIGPVYLFFLPGALAAGKRGRALALGALMIWAVAELIQFQPNPYDNNKLFYVAFILLVPLAAKYLVALYDRMKDFPAQRLLAGVFLLVCLISGGLSVARECVSEYELYGARESEAAAFIENNAPRDAVVLTGTQHNNPISSLTGRKIVCGTGSFLYYHGLDYGRQQRDVQWMYEDPTGNEHLFEQYGVDYIYISSNEAWSYAVDVETMEEKYDLVFDNGVKLFAVSDRARSIGAGTPAEGASR